MFIFVFQVVAGRPLADVYVEEVIIMAINIVDY
jgi:hypothetical protein